MSKEYLDWLKIDLNVAKTITVQDYKHTKNWCEWKYTYTMLKLRVKQVTWVRDKMIRQKAKENWPGMLKIYTFCWKIHQRVSGSGECYWGYVSMRIHSKSCCIFPKKFPQLYLVVQGRAQLEHSSHIVKVCVEATC